MAMLTQDALDAIGFAAVGENVRISSMATFYGASRITIGDNVRIDDFCVLSAGTGGIRIGRNVHIAAYSSLTGAGQIVLCDYCGLSSRVSIYSSSDDYSGATMTNPTVLPEYTGVTHADVFLGKHVIVGAGCVILPGATLEEGVAVGALSVVKQRCITFGIYAGNPARRVRERKRDLLDLESRFLANKR